jgi:hypothetical protein
MPAESTLLLNSGGSLLLNSGGSLLLHARGKLFGGSILSLFDDQLYILGWFDHELIPGATTVVIVTSHGIFDDQAFPGVIDSMFV